MGRVLGDGILNFYVQDVIVDEPYQGRGYGGMMMEKIMDYIGKNARKGSVIGLFSSRGREEFYMKYGFVKRPDALYGAGMFQTVGWDGQ